MRKNLVWIGIAAAVGYWIYRKLNLVNRSKILFHSIRLVGSGLRKQIEIGLKVQNPTRNSGTIENLIGEVFVNGKQVADFSVFQPQKIAPNSESILKILAAPNSGILELLTTKGAFKSGLNYTVKGSANFDGVYAPFQFDKKLI